MLNELAKEIYDTAAEKGWHEKSVSFGDCIANIHGEASEAFEEYRNGHGISEIYYPKCKHADNGTANEEYCKALQSADICNMICKPEGVPTELADIIIRVLDGCQMYGIDIDEAVKIKMEYNKTRPYRHGGKVV